MPFVDSGGVRLAYEETGRGYPVVFVHEFAGHLESWEPQLAHFARRYRCVAFNARGYPPSDVPSEPNAYSQEAAVNDIAAVMDQLDLARAHVVGLSMGAFAALHFALRFQERASAVVLAGIGYGALEAQQEQFRREVGESADRFEAAGMAESAAGYAATPHRAAFHRKDPRGFDEFERGLAAHSTDGSVRTLRGVQRDRPPLDTLPGLDGLSTPALIVAGDEDEPSLAPSLYLQRTLTNAALSIMPRTGHTINLEEPATFNALVEEFLAAVDGGRWETGEGPSGRIL